MECKIVKKAGFTVVGLSKIIKMEDGYKECPAFWDELIEKGVNNYLAGTFDIEYYTNPKDYPNGNQDENYYCEIWLPVKAKN